MYIICMCVGVWLDFSNGCYSIVDSSRPSQVPAVHVSAVHLCPLNRLLFNCLLIVH